MGEIFSKMQPPIDLPDKSCSGKKFMKERSVLLKNGCAYALETNTIANASTVEWLWSTNFDKNDHE